MHVMPLLQPGWGPPKEAMAALVAQLDDTDNHLYGSIMGLEELRQRLQVKVQAQGLSMADQDIMITCGAQQAYINAVLCLLDHGDLAFLLCPYYMSHKLGIQVAAIITPT
jgi:aspartate/methionine/tyrosine aminotransferase